METVTQDYQFAEAKRWFQKNILFGKLSETIKDDLVKSYQLLTPENASSLWGKCKLDVSNYWIIENKAFSLRLGKYSAAVFCIAAIVLYSRKYFTKPQSNTVASAIYDFILNISGAAMFVGFIGFGTSVLCYFKIKC